MTNVDPEEIHKFDQLAKDWWDPNGPMQPLHALNPVRLEFIEQTQPLKGQTVLDVGCGAGLLSEAMAKAGAKVTAVDLSQQAIDIAKQHAEQQNVVVDYQLRALETLLETHAQQFDVVTCMEMLEHVPDPAQTIQHCAALVKPGGYCFFSTLNRNPKAFLKAIVGAEYLLRLLPIGTHSYSKFIRPSELKRWADTAALDFVKVAGIDYHPFSKKAALSRDVSVNYLISFLRK